MRRLALLELGFRPFYLLASAFAALSIALWAAQLSGMLPGAYLAGPAWHAHEMLFGYTEAVLAGFILIGTAGWRIPALAALWLAGRAAMALPGAVPPEAAAALDLAFAPALALLRTPPLWRPLKWPTTGFLPLLGALAAADESVALAWDMAEWPVLVARHPRLATNALRTMGGRLQEQQTKVREIATERVERRIAHVLLRLARQAGRRIETGVEIEFPITRQDIAEMTAATLFTVSRVMREWEQAGLVEGGRQRIVVRDSQALVRIAEDSGGRSAGRE
jgi:uncharacterized protein involved in response to NO